MIEPLRQAMANGLFKHRMIENRRKDEASERRLGLHRRFCLGADLGPDRIDDLNFGRCCF
jgi:hypothetical protein